MRLGLLADVHSNLQALEAVLEDAERCDIDEWVFLGDAVGYNANPTECCRILRDLDPTSVKGNHDEAVLTGEASWFNSAARAGVDHSMQNLAKDAQQWLASLPEEASVVTPALRVHVVHGSPRDPLREYVLPEEPAGFFDELLAHPSVAGAGALVLGHTHIPLDKTLARGRIVNPGSVGQPRDLDARAAWAYVDMPVGRSGPRVTFRRVPYDVEGAQDAIRKAHLPEVLAVRLGQGL